MGGRDFSPGTTPFAPVNLSAAGRLVFWVRGAANGAAVFAFSGATGQRPAVAGFKVGEDWREISIPFTSIGGFDPLRAQALAVVASGAPGAFAFEVADVRLLK